jgi:hypothetical protein
MRLDVELSDDMYRQWMLKAEEEGIPVHDLILRAVERELYRTSCCLNPDEATLLRTVCNKSTALAGPI